MRIDPNSKLSEKQKKFFDAPKSWLNFLVGAVRSGKTYVSLYFWLLWVLTFPKGSEFLMVGRTLNSLERNCLGICCEISELFTYNKSQKVGYFAGRKIWLEGANDVKSEAKIRGMTLQGAYVDELTLIPISFFMMLLSRLSMRGAKLFATTNPDHSRHWVKTDYVDNKDLDISVFNFELDDNPFLPAEYVERLKQAYLGSVYYDRFVLGKWVNAEGIVFKQFANDPKRWLLDNAEQGYGRLFVGVDYGGNKSKTIFICAGEIWKDGQPQIHVLEFQEVKSNNGFDISTNDIVTQFKTFFNMIYNKYGQYPQKVFTDHLIAITEDISRSIGGGRCQLVDKNTISLGEWTKYINSLFNLDKLKIVKHNESVTDCFSGLLYDDGESDGRPLDDGNQSCDMDTYDATRYAISQIVFDWISRGIINA